MDPITIAAALTPILAPFVRRAGSEVGDQLAARLGREAADALGSLWDRLRGHLPEAQREDVAAGEEALEEQIARVLAAHPDLLREAETLVVSIQGSHNVVQHGDQNINISGGSDIHIGDR